MNNENNQSSSSVVAPVYEDISDIEILPQDDQQIVTDPKPYQQIGECAVILHQRRHLEDGIIEETYAFKRLNGLIDLDNTCSLLINENHQSDSESINGVSMNYQENITHGNSVDVIPILGQPEEQNNEHMDSVIPILGQPEEQNNEHMDSVAAGSDHDEVPYPVILSSYSLAHLATEDPGTSDMVDTTEGTREMEDATEPMMVTEASETQGPVIRDQDGKLVKHVIPQSHKPDFMDLVRQELAENGFGAPMNTYKREIIESMLQQNDFKRRSLDESEDTVLDTSFDISSVLTNQDLKRLYCPICEKYYSCRSALRKHVKKYHNPSKKHENSTSDLPNFVNSAESVGMKCVECGKIFIDKTSLMIHVEKYHNQYEEQGATIDSVISPDSGDDLQNAEDTYCEICDRFYSCKANLRKHIRRSHPIFTNSNPNDAETVGRAGKSGGKEAEISQVDTSNEVDSSVEENYCDICDKYFSCRPYYRKHMRKFHGMSFRKRKHVEIEDDDVSEISSMDKSVEPKLLLQNNKDSKPENLLTSEENAENLYCQSCERYYSCRSSWRHHMKKYHEVSFEEKMNVQDEDDLVSDASNIDRPIDLKSLENDALINEENAENLYCQRCERYYMNRQSWRKHMQRKHQISFRGKVNVQNEDDLVSEASNLDRPNESKDDNENGSVNESTLINEENAEKLYCQICERYYSCRTSWKKHMRQIHQVSFDDNSSNLDTSVEEKSLKNDQDEIPLVNSENAENLYCRRCERYYSCRTSWREHMKNIHSISFKTPRNTDEKSEKQSDLEVTDNHDDGSVDIDKLVSSVNEENLYCEICTRHYSNRPTWMKHMRTFHEVSFRKKKKVPTATLR